MTGRAEGGAQPARLRLTLAGELALGLAVASGAALAIHLYVAGLGAIAFATGGEPLF